MFAFQRCQLLGDSTCRWICVYRAGREVMKLEASPAIRDDCPTTWRIYISQWPIPGNITPRYTSLNLHQYTPIITNIHRYLEISPLNCHSYSIQSCSWKHRPQKESLRKVPFPKNMESLHWNLFFCYETEVWTLRMGNAYNRRRKWLCLLTEQLVGKTGFPRFSFQPSNWWLILIHNCPRLLNETMKLDADQSILKITHRRDWARVVWALVYLMKGCREF